METIDRGVCGGVCFLLWGEPGLQQKIGVLGLAFAFLKAMARAIRAHANEEAMR